MKKRILSIVLILCMVLMLCPVTAFADNYYTVTLNFKYGTLALISEAENPHTFTAPENEFFMLTKVENCAPYEFVGWKESVSGTVYEPWISLPVANLTFDAVYQLQGSIAVTVNGFEVGNTPNDITFSFASTIPGIEFSEDDIQFFSWEKCIFGEETSNLWHHVYETEAFEAGASYRISMNLDNKGLDMAPAVTVNGRTPYYCKIATRDGVPIQLQIACTLGTPAEPPAPSLVRGDIDLDGEVTVKDATMLQDCLENPESLEKLTSEQYEAADFNGDGAVTESDLTALRSFLNPITIDGPDVVCAQQDYEFTVTPADGVTLEDWFWYENDDADGYAEQLTIDEDGVGHGVVPASEYGDADRMKLTVSGAAADGTPVFGTKGVQILKEHRFVDGVCGCGAVQQYTITYDPGEGKGSIADGIKTHGDNFTLSRDTFTRAGYEQTGWATSDGGEKVYDLGGTYTENKDITLYPVWSDIENPKIIGIEDGKTYCSAQTVTVSDNDAIATVTVNGTEVNLDANKQFTLPANGEQTIVATDKSNNETSVIVTVNNGHTADNDDGNCSTPVYCIYHPDTVVVAAKSHDFSGEWNKDEDGHWHICQNAGCTVAEAKAHHSGTDDGDCTTAVVCECGYIITAAKSQHSYGEWQSNGNGTHTRRCTVTGCNGYEDGNCTGGTATCTSKAICEYCKTEYGEFDSSNHNLEKIPAKDATVTATGNKEYWHCKDCKKYFSDVAGTNEIKLDDTVISKLSPEIIEGKGQSITAGEKKELTFKSNAAFSDFIRVELDGKTLDAKNYTVKEGSTVVTLKADYVATLSAGEHTIGIVSESGTATTTFTVNAKTVVDNDTKSPQTGDNSHMALWIALLAASVFGLAGTAVYSKRKRVR